MNISKFVGEHLFTFNCVPSVKSSQSNNWYLLLSVCLSVNVHNLVSIHPVLDIFLIYFDILNVESTSDPTDS